MKNIHDKKISTALLVAFLLALCFATQTGNAAPRHTTAPSAVPADEFQANPAVSSGSVIVTPKFGGAILGYDIDRNGSEGLLSEYIALPNGESFVATEIFSQKT